MAGHTASLASFCLLISFQIAISLGLHLQDNQYVRPFYMARTLPKGVAFLIGWPHDWQARSHERPRVVYQAFMTHYTSTTKFSSCEIGGQCCCFNTLIAFAILGYLLSIRLLLKCFYCCPLNLCANHILDTKSNLRVIWLSCGDRDHRHRLWLQCAKASLRCWCWPTEDQMSISVFLEVNRT